MIIAVRFPTSWPAAVCKSPKHAQTVPPKIMSTLVREESGGPQPLPRQRCAAADGRTARSTPRRPAPLAQAFAALPAMAQSRIPPRRPAPLAQAFAALPAMAQSRIPPRRPAPWRRRSLTTQLG
jgi:hypothetical protein